MAADADPTTWEASGEVLAGRCLAPVAVYAPGNYQAAFAVAGLIDTGAMQSAVSLQLASFLALPIGGQSNIASATQGLQLVPRFSTTLEFLRPGLEGNAWVRPNFMLTGMPTPMIATHLLIGMDIVGLGELTVRDGVWRLRLPG